MADAESRQKFLPQSSPNRTDAHSQYGRYFEEFEVGQVYQAQTGITLDAGYMVQLCMLTYTHNPLHLDRNFVDIERPKLPERVVPGHVLMALAIGLSIPDLSGKAEAQLAVHEWKFDRAVCFGDTIYISTEIESVVEGFDSRKGRRTDCGVVRGKIVVRNQHGEICAYGARSVLIPKKPVADA